jgi:hypothetical protein
VTTTLKGELGTVKGSEAATGVVLLILPESSKTWTTLAATECSPESRVTGSIAAELAPTLKSQTTVKLSVAPGSVKQVNILGTTVEPLLVAFSEEATVEQAGELTSAEAVEVT